MDKNLQDIEDLFRKGLEDNEEIPSENTWGRIDKILDKDKVISISKKYNFLKKIAFLLMFFLTMLSIYVWIKRDNKYPEKNTMVILKKEKQPNNNAAPPYGINKIDLKRPIDSINVIVGNNQNLKKEIGHTKIDKNILKKQTEKTLTTSSITKSISNLPVYKESNISEENTKPGITKSILNSSISDKEKLQENKLGKEGNIKIPTHIKDELGVVVKPANIDSNQTFFPLIQLHFWQVTEVKSSISGLIKTKNTLMANAFAETNEPVNKSKSILKNKFIKLKKPFPFSITVFYSPDVSFFHLQDNHSGNQNSNAMDIENNETGTFAYNIGALIDYKPGWHWSLQSGLMLSTTNIDINPKTIYANADNTGSVKYQINTSLGYGFILPSFSNNPNVGDSISSLSTTSTLQYLGIPLAAKYSLDEGKFSINAMAGLLANFLTRGKIATEVEQGTDNEIEKVNKIYGLKKFYLSGIAGVGLDYNFYKKLSLSFSPTLRFALNAINKNGPVTSYPNSLGFALGLKVKL